MLTKISPDKQKAIALIKIAEITLERLEKTDKEIYPSNTLIDYYDIIHNFLESIAFKEGVKAKGDGAHRELIDYVAKQHDLSEQIRQFLQQLRDYRNRISYEGFIINRDFIATNEENIKRIIDKLRKL